MTQNDTRRLGDYELLFELKSGGMGDVFLARKGGSGDFEKLVAIKTMRRELSDQPELRTMFLDEARLLARLEHPAVAQVHDFGEADKTQYLAMEYVAGVSFADLVRGGVPPGVVIRLLAIVCHALHAAHELRDMEGNLLDVVHRDVSPDNLMLSFDGHVKVLDFGIALMRGRHSPATEYGTVKGKPPYLSPEQVKGQRVDRRSDIWSTGVVLWELLTRKNLFDGDSLLAIALAVDSQEIPLPSQVVGSLPEGLDAIVMRALSRDPDQRYQTAEQMAKELEQLATSIAAPSVSEFAKAALGVQGQEHRKWLGSILKGDEQLARGGRPTGMRTMLAEGQMPASVDALDAVPTEVAMETVSVFSRGRIALLALLLLAIAGAGSWLALSSSSSKTKSVAVSQKDAMVAALPVDFDASAPALVVPDAGSADASTKLDARSGPGDRLTKRRVPKPDSDKERADTNNSDLPPEPTGTGTLTIAAKPYALVRLNGKEIGATPQLAKSYPAGTYVIELIHPDTGALRLRRTVKLVDGAHKKVIDR